MATLLADPPAQSDGQHAPAGGPGDGAESGRQRACASCGAPLAPDQDWCLQCGAAAPGSLLDQRSHWRASAAVLSALALLLVGAGAAAYAALNKSSSKPRASLTLARAGALAPGARAAPPPSTAAPLTPAAPKLSLPPTAKAHVPLVKPPKIPLVASSKAPAATAPAAATNTPTSTGTLKTTPATTTTTTTSAEAKPPALTLDTNAASTYNPYGYAASNFGDPSLAIDGETSTAWTAKVEASVAPKMAEGLLIDLNAPQRLSALVLVTSTPGMSVQVYGATGSAAPASITAPAWARLSGVLVAHKRSTRISLGNSNHAYRFVTLWISQAPAGARRVSVNEAELFPAR